MRAVAVVAFDHLTGLVAAKHVDRAAQTVAGVTLPAQVLNHFLGVSLVLLADFSEMVAGQTVVHPDRLSHLAVCMAILAHLVRFSQRHGLVRGMALAAMDVFRKMLLVQAVALDPRYLVLAEGSDLLCLQVGGKHRLLAPGVRTAGAVDTRRT